MALMTLIHGIRGVARGVLNADPLDVDAVAARRQACARCEMATHRKNLGHLGTGAITPASTCRVCHCHIQLKTRLAGESCPLARW